MAPLCRASVNCVNSQETAVPSLQQYREESAIIPHDATTRNLSRAGNPAFIRNLPRRQHMLRLSNGRRLGDRADPDRKMLCQCTNFHTESVTGSQAPLLRRSGRQAGKSDHIPGVNNMGDVRSICSVNRPRPSAFSPAAERFNRSVAPCRPALHSVKSETSRSSDSRRITTRRDGPSTPQTALPLLQVEI